MFFCSEAGTRLAVDGSTASPLLPTGRRWSYRDALRTGASLLLLVGGGVLAARGVPAPEAEVFEAVNGLPGALWPVVWPVMQLGSLIGALAVAALLGLGTRRPSVGACAAGAVLVSWLAAKWVKGIVGRERPFGVGLDVIVRDHATYGLGYVSGHAALAAAAYTVAIPHLRGWWRPFALALLIVVGFGRIYAGAHLPLDVIGGAAMGVLIGEAFRLVEVRWRTGRVPRPADLAAPADEPTVGESVGSTPAR